MNVNEDASLMEVTAYPMSTSNGQCNWGSSYQSINEGDAIKTTNEDGTTYCGYYVEYQWTGVNKAFFQINTNNAIINTFSAIGMLCLASLTFA